MKFRFSSITAMVFALVISPLSYAAQSEYDAWQEDADRVYASGDYPKAYSKYLKLAKKGDSFSQYRVSYMNLEALGMNEADVVEAFAWAVLAAQSGQSELVKYRRAVAEMVPENKQRKALRKVDFYMRRWGNIALAQDAIVGAREQTRDCTGSRLGQRCDEVYAASMPKFWGTSPGIGGGADGGSAAPSGSRSAAQTGVGGGNGRDMAHFQSLRDQIATLNRYIQENAGKVEIGELEVVEEEAAAKEKSGQP